jgi:predicted CopG family antitoxin
MAVKTITIDMEAYEALSKRKRTNESFSKVIKRILREDRYSAKNLFNHLTETAFSNETLNAVDKQVRLRDQTYPEEISLD